MKAYYEDEWATIYHGDCREILPQLEPVDLVLTDPPYGIALSSGWNGQHGECSIAGDEDCAARDYAIAAAKYDAAYVFGSHKIRRPAGYKALLIWDKGEHVGMGDLSFPWKPNFEEIYIFGDGFKGRRESSVLRFLAVAGCVGRRTSRAHPTEKPLDLLRYLLGRRPSKTVLDMFAGSCSTLRAAKQLGIKSIGIEIEEKYCEVGANMLRQQVIWELMELEVTR